MMMAMGAPAAADEASGDFSMQRSALPAAPGHMTIRISGKDRFHSLRHAFPTPP